MSTFTKTVAFVLDPSSAISGLSSLTSEFKKTEAAVKKTETALSKVLSQISDRSKFTEAAVKLRDFNAALQVAARRSDTLTDSLTKMSAVLGTGFLKGASTGLSQMSKDLTAINNKTKALGRNSASLMSGLTSASGKNVVTSSIRLKGNLKNVADSAKDFVTAMKDTSGIADQARYARSIALDLEKAASFSSKVNRKTQRSTGTGSPQSGGTTVTTGALAGAYLVTAPIRDGIQVLRDYEKALAATSVAAGGTAEDVVKLKKVISEQIKRGSLFGPEEIANAYETSIKAGLTQKQATLSVPVQLDFAVVADSSPEKAAEVLNSVAKTFNINASDIGKVGDIIAAEVNKTTDSVSSFASAIKYAGPVANSMGMSLEETAAILGRFADSSYKGTSGGTALRRMLGLLAAPTERAKKLLKAYGLEAEDVSPINGKLFESIKKLRDAGVSAEDSFRLFGKEGAAMYEILARDEEIVKSLQKEIENSSGSLKGMADLLKENLDAKFRQATASAKSFATALGNAGGTNALIKGLDLAAKAFNYLSDNASTVLTVLASAGTVLLAGPFVRFLKFLIGGITPIGVLTTTLVGLGIEAYKASGEVGLLGTVFDAVKSTGSLLKDTVADLGSSIFDTAAQAVSGTDGIGLLQNMLLSLTGVVGALSLGIAKLRMWLKILASEGAGTAGAAISDAVAKTKAYSEYFKEKASISFGGLSESEEIRRADLNEKNLKESLSLIEKETQTKKRMSKEVEDTYTREAEVYEETRKKIELQMDKAVEKAGKFREEYTKYQKAKEDAKSNSSPSFSDDDKIQDYSKLTEEARKLLEERNKGSKVTDFVQKTKNIRFDNFNSLQSSLEDLNVAMGAYGKEYENAIELNKAAQDLGRDLTATERAQIIAITEKTRAAAAARDLYNSLHQAEIDRENRLSSLNILLKDGKISQTEYGLEIQKTTFAYEKAKGPLEEMFRGLEDEKKVLSELNETRREQIKLIMSAEDAAGRPLSPAEAQKLRALNEEIELMKTKIELKERLEGPKLKAKRGLEALDQLGKEDSKNAAGYGGLRDELRLEQLNNTQTFNFADGFLKQLEIMKIGSKNASSDIGTSFAEVVGPGGTLTTSLADIGAKALVMGEDWKASIAGVAQSMLTNLVSALIETGLNMALNAALGQSLQAATTASSVAAAGVTAAAWAPAAAAASLATAGSNAAPASLGIGSIFSLMAAMIGGMAIGGLKDGGDVTGPGTGRSDSILKRLSHGEFVMNARSAERHRPLLHHLNNGGSLSSGNNIKITVINNASNVVVEPEKDRDGNLRIIVRQELAKAVPDMMAGEAGNRYSKFNKAFKQTNKVTPNLT